MKENYKAWQISIDDFYPLQKLEDTLRFLLKFAVLAPSPHNTQPWDVSISNNTITIKPQLERALPVGDTSQRLLFVGLGCFLENLLIAADYYRLLPQVQYPTNENEVLIKVDVPEKSERPDGDSHLIFNIQKRFTDRSRYRQYELPSTFLAQINALSFPDLDFHVITDKRMKDLITDITLRGVYKAWSDGAFRKELSRWVKPNDTESKTGMPGFVIGFPKLVSYIIPKVLPKAKMANQRVKADGVTLNRFTPGFGIITGDDSKKQWIQTGQLYERIALLGVKENISTHIMTAAIDDDECAWQLQHVLRTDRRPLLFFRMGYSEKPPLHSPRIPAEEVLV